jgi:hypothetical protein
MPYRVTANFSESQIFNFLNFEVIKNPSCGFLHIINTRLFTRGIRKIIKIGMFIITAQPLYKSSGD